MPKQADIEHLRSVKTLPQLIRYLRDDLDWPIDQDATEDVATFEYSLEEIGLSKDYNGIIKEVKQIRPLDSKQPWGIFWLNFDKKRLPVVILRRILGNLAIKTRTKGSKSQQAAWHRNDLMFISAYGEESDRAITFAHFSQNPENPNDLPVLKVLGWDDDDTNPHLADVHSALKENLRWPANYENLDSWRKQWTSAFILGHREVITTTEKMVEELARLATAIYKRTKTAIKKESEKGPLRRLHASFKAALIHDLDEDDFADVIAQTISYGLLTARFSRPAGITVQNLVDMVLPTNPFLRELLGTFLHLAGRRSIFDFDELGIQDVVDLLNRANTDAVKNDFGNKTRGEDPVIHFYEHFLSAYNKKQKVQRGVFYTPQPVVSYIVRSVHELLQTEFGLEDGLASTVTWREMAKRNKGLKIPGGVELDSAFVQILDPATGTATFLVEVIDVIHKTLMAKWQKQGMSKQQRVAAWNEYVPEHLLTRLHGYELMMAPYAIAHMKIGLKLSETGYGFLNDERARIYLTNALEPWQDFSDRLAFDVPALAHEAQAVNAIKRHQRFTVVIGNPPYSGHSANKSRDDDGNVTFIGELIEHYKTVDGKPLGERQPKWLQDDYVKFTRFAQWCLDNTKCGQLGFITNHSYADNPTFRGMRQSLLTSFDRLYIRDLHGNSNKSERAADGSPDENVFDIQQGVAILLGCKSPKNDPPRTVNRDDLVGSRSSKYATLSAQSASGTAWTRIEPCTPAYLFISQNTELAAEYHRGWRITDVFPANNVGFVTARDAFVIDFDDGALRRRIAAFRLLAAQMPTAEIQKTYGLKDTTSWGLEEARESLRRNPDWESYFTKCLYRPFDIRHIYYSADMLERPVFQIQRHMLPGKNVGLLWTRPMSPQFEFSVSVTRHVVDQCVVGNKSAGAGISYLGPLFLQPDARHKDLKLFGETIVPNIGVEFLSELARVSGIAKREANGLPAGLKPEDIFHYAYALFHSPCYRRRYAEFLKRDFPRLPLTSSLELFHALAKLGGELVALHLMESPRLNKPIAKWSGKSPSCEVEKVAYSDHTVWIDKTSGQGFVGVPEEVFYFCIGGYQVCEKWLKDRKGRKLSKDDIDHYQKIVVALSETIHLMAEIDKAIDSHGGWPKAFQ